jgi:hypothetical protein
LCPSTLGVKTEPAPYRRLVGDVLRAASLRRTDQTGRAEPNRSRRSSVPDGIPPRCTSAVTQQHAYGAPDDNTGPYPTPLTQLRNVLDELVDAQVLDRRRRDGIEYPIWSTVHGLAVLTGQGPLRGAPDSARRHLERLISAFIGFALGWPNTPHGPAQHGG